MSISFKFSRGHSNRGITQQRFVDMSKIYKQAAFLWRSNVIQGHAFCTHHHFVHNSCGKIFCLNLPDGVATVRYKEEGKIYNLEHTEVPDVYKGKGVGSHIAKEVLDYCLNNKISVRLTCEFLCEYIRKHPEYNSIVVKEDKEN